MKDRYEIARPELIANCDYRCPLNDGRATIFDIATDDGSSKTSLKDDPGSTIDGINGWYFAPQPSSTVNWIRFLNDVESRDKLEVDKQICSFAAPLIGSSISGIFTGKFGGISYLGLANVGLMC